MPMNIELSMVHSAKKFTILDWLYRMSQKNFLTFAKCYHREFFTDLNDSNSG